MDQKMQSQLLIGKKQCIPLQERERERGGGGMVHDDYVILKERFMCFK